MHYKYDYIISYINDYTRIWIDIKCLSGVHAHSMYKHIHMDTHI